MIELLKKIMPNTYILYQHYLRTKDIKRVNTIKKATRDQYPELVKKRYEEVTGKKLDWNNLVTYREKMQWAKVYDTTPLKTRLADKYLVREWIREKIGEEYLIPLLGVWNSFDEIDFKQLPSQFVLKTNHSSGFNIVVKDKNNLNMRSARSMFNDWMKIDFAFYNGFELQYSGIDRKIVAEKYITDSSGSLPDYKFICFDGKPYFCCVDIGRYVDHIQYVFDMNWQLQPWTDGFSSKSDYVPPKPDGFDEMVEIATSLCDGFGQVRVDLYNVDGRIYFGEMTFTDGAGYDPIEPEEYDTMLGNLWKIDLPKKD